MLSDDEWKLYHAQYGALINYIAHRITGDPSNCCVEDNIQDLNIAAMNSIAGYRKKNNTAAPLSEIMQDPKFASYTKTCLWNSKNNKGIKATRHKDTFVELKENYYE